jgi:hypothetical protein
MTNRIDPLGPPSPTGTPLIPPFVVPWLVGLVGMAGTAVQVLPINTVAFKIANAVLAFGALIGIASPGMRK